LSHVLTIKEKQPKKNSQRKTVKEKQLKGFRAPMACWLNFYFVQRGAKRPL
jgi:hypothetical protein